MIVPSSFAERYANTRIPISDGMDLNEENNVKLAGIGRVREESTCSDSCPVLSHSLTNSPQIPSSVIPLRPKMRYDFK